MFRSILCTGAIVLVVFTHLAAAPPIVQRKPTPSKFEIRDLNKFMLAAVDNSANNVKFSAPPGDYTVHGQVLDPNGEPVAGAQVLLSEATRGLYLYLANFDVTDRQGRFVVTAAPGSDYLYVKAGDVHCKMKTDGADEVVVRVPRMHAVHLQPPRDLKLFDDNVWVKSRQVQTGEVAVFGNISTKLAASQAGKFKLAPGSYLVSGGRHIETDGDPQRGPIELGEIQVADSGQQTFQLGRRGTQVKGRITDFKQRYAADKVLAVQASLTLVQTKSQSEYRTIDTVKVEPSGNFEFERIPPGVYLLTVTSVPRPSPQPKVPLRGRGGFGGFAGLRTAVTNTQSFKERFEVADKTVSIKLPIGRPTDTTVQQVHRILDSEHPAPNATWSWTDVQVSQLRAMKDRQGMTAELLRLLEAEDTPRSWQYLVIHSLWRIHPITDQTKSALVSALSNPKHAALRGSILSTLRNMGPNAIDLVDLIINMKDDESWRVRYAVADSMGRIGQTMVVPSNEMVQTAIDLLEDPHGSVRVQAAGSLGRLHSPRAVEALKRRMQDPYGPARAMAAWALFESSGDAEPALSAMIDLLEHGDHDAKKEAASYLEMFDHRAAPALKALRANTSYDKKPPFTSPRQTIQYQLRGAAERAIAAIEGSLAWHAQSDRFEIQVEPVLDPVQWQNASFGTAVEGLALGIAIDSQQSQFVSGERVPLSLLIRNVTDQPIRFELDRRLPDLAPMLEDANGLNIRPANKRLLVAKNFFDVTLPAESVFRISHPGLGVGTNPNPGGRLWFPYTEKLGRGPHQVSQRFRVEVIDDRSGVKKRTWLTSGKVLTNLVQ